MNEKKVKIWEPISFGENWEKSDTSKFDELASSWYEKRKELKEDNKEFNDFFERLKRQHAIETGIIEKLYDLSEGITQTFIKEGFVENFISHDDTNIPASKLMGYLKSHFEGMDFVFDIVKENRPLTKSFILELHQLILKHQDSTTALDSLNNIVQVPILKGKFKELPNNPQREDGTIYEYCPPMQVNAEIDNLLRMFNELEEKRIHPLIISTWFHHAFTQIHPFQDGNGRIARLLTSLILIKHRLFPLNILRQEKPEYIDALEEADKGNPNDLVVFFSKIQRKSIETALNIQAKPDSLKEVAEIFREKVELLSTRQRQERLDVLNKNLELLIECVFNIIGGIQNELFASIPKEKAYIQAIAVRPDDEQHYYYTKQIIEYANQHNYFFNKNFPRGWFRLSFHVAKEKRYDIVISVHHYGYFDSVVALGSFIEFIDKSHDDENRIEQTIPIDFPPYTVSLENEFTEKTKMNIKAYLNDIIKIGMSIITNEIT